MKKIVTMSALVTVICFAACAQKIDASKVPAAAKASFEKKYPGTKATWEMEDGKYEVNFKQNGNATSVLIDEKGVISETEMDIKMTDLPASAQAYIKEHYKGKSIKETTKITNADGSINYEVEVAGKDVMFDAGGKFLKEIEKKD